MNPAATDKKHHVSMDTLFRVIAGLLLTVAVALTSYSMDMVLSNRDRITRLEAYQEGLDQKLSRLTTLLDRLELKLDSLRK